MTFEVLNVTIGSPQICAQQSTSLQLLRSNTMTSWVSLNTKYSSANYTKPEEKGKKSKVSRKIAQGRFKI